MQLAQDLFTVYLLVLSLPAVVAVYLTVRFVCRSVLVSIRQR